MAGSPKKAKKSSAKSHKTPPANGVWFRTVADARFDEWTTEGDTDGMGPDAPVREAIFDDLEIDKSKVINFYIHLIMYI